MKYGIQDDVIFTGPLNDLVDIYNISSCVVIPSLSEESFCFVAVEAMASKTPIIAFDSGALPEVLNVHGTIIKKNSKLLAKAVINTLTNINNVQDDSMFSYVSNNFLIEDNISKHIDLYMELLRK